MDRVFFPGISVFLFAEILMHKQEECHANSSILKRTTSINLIAFLNFFLDFKHQENEQMWP